MSLELMKLFFRKSGKRFSVIRYFFILISGMLICSCNNTGMNENRIPVAKAGDQILYLDQIPDIVPPSTSPEDSISIIHNFVNSWARKELLYLKAEENLSPENKSEIEAQMRDTRTNLVIYQYQRQMMLQRMDTTISEEEMDNYYATNEKKFSLSSNIVKALFIKVPSDVPSLDKIRMWSRSADQNDLQQLETLCYQFAEKFDDFGEDWVTMDRLCVELPQDIVNQESFLRYNTHFETRDSSSIYLITFRDYRLRHSLAPYDYVRNDIKNIILNNRRFIFLQELEKGIYNEALKANLFTQY